MKPVLRLGCVFAAFLLLALNAGFARAESIKIGIVQTLAVGPVFVAAERGYFTAEGFRAELVYFDAA